MSITNDRIYYCGSCRIATSQLPVAGICPNCGKSFGNNGALKSDVESPLNQILQMKKEGRSSMVKIYIGIENGVIGSTYSNIPMEVIIVDSDQHSIDPTVVTKCEVTLMPLEEIDIMIARADKEEKQSRKEWNDYEITGE